MEEVWGVRISLLCYPPSGKIGWSGRDVHVVAQASAYRDPTGPTVRGSDRFGGHNGWRTMAAAWLWALYDLGDQLERQLEQASGS